MTSVTQSNVERIGVLNTKDVLTWCLLWDLDELCKENDTFPKAWLYYMYAVLIVTNIYIKIFSYHYDDEMPRTAGRMWLL